MGADFTKDDLRGLSGTEIHLLEPVTNDQYMRLWGSRQDLATFALRLMDERDGARLEVTEALLCSANTLRDERAAHDLTAGALGKCEERLAEWRECCVCATHFGSCPACSAPTELKAARTALAAWKESRDG